MQPVWVRNVDNQYAENDLNEIDGKTDFMIKLLDKLPHVVTKPIVVQHTQTVDEQFTLTVNEENENGQQLLPKQSILPNSATQIQGF